MTAKTGQVCGGAFVTKNGDGVPMVATVGPVGTFYKNGTATADAVAITGTGPIYKWAATMPALVAGDRVQVYGAATVDGQALGDFIWEEFADTKLTSDLNDLAAGAAMTLTAAYDAAKAAAPVGAAMTLTGAYDAAKTAAQAGALTTHDGKLDTVDTVVDAILADTSALGGAGAISKTITIDDGTNPLDGVEVWVTTDLPGSNVVASSSTDTLGHVTFRLDAGSYYVWCQLAGHNDPGPTTVVWS